MLFIHNPFKNAFGLDLGDFSIKLVALKKRWNPIKGVYFAVKGMRQISLPIGYLANGEIQQPKLVKEKIQLLLSNHKGMPKIKSSLVVANLPVPQTFIKLIYINSPASEISDEIVRFEANKHMPYDIKDMKVDWQIISNQNEGDRYTSVLIGAVPKSVINSYMALLSSAGLVPLALEIEELSLIRSMISNDKQKINKAYAVLDLGDSRSILMIYDKGSLQYSSVINFSGDLINTILMQKLKVDRTTANKLKLKYGISYCSKYPEYLKIITELTEKLVNNVMTILLFYNNHFRNPNPVIEITMSGGSSLLLNLDKFLTEKLDIKIVHGDAWQNLSNSKIAQSKNKGLSMASAVGLALRAVNWPI